MYRAGLVGEVITWVPGRRRDIRRRGYDHAALLAAGLAAELGLPRSPLLRRVRTTDDQSELSRAGRRANVTGAFSARRCPPRVVLVDDVVTTGATVDSCEAALRSAGARSIEVVVAALA